MWGGGQEDKALQNRAEFRKVIIKKNILNNNPQQSKYLLRFENPPDKYRIAYKGHNYYSNRSNETEILSSGLNNLEYKILERKDINNYIELIKVSI